MSPTRTDQQTIRTEKADGQGEPLQATEARQGLPGRPVLVVLLAGLLLALLVWIPVEWWGNGMAPEQPATSEQTTPAPSPADNTTGNTGTQPSSNP